MKKKLLGVLLASFALMSVSQAKFYVGVEGGYSAESGYKTGLKNLKSVVFSAAPSSTIGDAFKKDTGVQGYSIGAVFGTEDFFGKYFGTRWGIGAGYTSVGKKPNVGEYFDLGFNLDLMLNFINTGSFSFGVFGGASADYHYFMSSDGHHYMDFSGRVGLSTLVASHHRIEFFAKLPIGSLNATDDKEPVLGSQFVSARTTLGASYKFVF